MAFDFKKHWWIILIAALFIINNQTSQQAIVNGVEEEIVDIIHPYQEMDIKKQAIIDCATAGGGCVDSDGGLNYYVKGNVCLFSKSYPDECLDDETLKEYYCNAGAAFSKKVTQSGYTCVYSKLGRCTDSDGGKYPKEYGVVTSANGVKYEDYCVGTDSVKVKEYSCGADNAVIGTTMTLSGYKCDGGELVKTDDECEIEDTYSCYSGDVYWYSSCGVRGGIKEECDEDCKDTKCVDEVDTACVANKYYCDKGIYARCKSDGSVTEIIGECSSKTCAIEQPAYGDSSTAVCGSVQVTCPDGLCSKEEGLSESCPADCISDEVCGDDVCIGDEPQTCPADCEAEGCTAEGGTYYMVTSSQIPDWIIQVPDKYKLKIGKLCCDGLSAYRDKDNDWGITGIVKLEAHTCEKTPSYCKITKHLSFGQDFIKDECTTGLIFGLILAAILLPLFTNMFK